MGACPGGAWGPVASLVQSLSLKSWESDPSSWSRPCSSPPGLSFPICKMGHQYLPSYSPELWEDQMSPQTRFHS